MKLKHAILGAALTAVAVVPALVEKAKAQEGIFVPLLTYRTGAFANSGIPVADSMSDYFRLLNERDGGIGGVRIITEECETQYDAKRGVECYEATKAKHGGAVVMNPYSTGITLQLIPKAQVDKIPVLSMAYGLSASAVGSAFPWVFNPPATYWDGLSMIVRHIADQEGGLDKLRGKKIGYIYLDAGYGREPLPLLDRLAEQYGFTTFKYPVPAAEMQNQSGIWLNVRRDRPDYMVMWGWGAMNPTAIREAARVNFPMDKFIGIWWSGADDDARPAGADAKGYKSLSFSGVGADYALHKEILTRLHGAGKGTGSADLVGTANYNRGIYNAVLVAEAIRNAQRITGKKVVNGADVRRGFETLNITEARWKELGLEGFGQAVRTTCDDHNGHGSARITQWDGTKWVVASPWIQPMKDIVRPLLEAAAADYVSKNQPWPARTEPCDKSS
jgi:branched-chain amino acid transport system substrate-binding protein